MQLMKRLIFCGMLCIALPLGAQRVTVTSPDGKIGMEVESGASLHYQIRYNGVPVIIDSPLGFELVGEAPLTGGLKLLDQPEIRRAEEHWTPVVQNRHARVDAVWNEATLCLQEPDGERRKMDLEIKVFDEGVAFRYRLSGNARLTSREISRECTGFRVPGAASAWVADYERHVTSQEKEFKKMTVDAIGEETLAGLPLLVEAGPGCWLAVTEAHIDHYPGFFIGMRDCLLQTLLSPLPGNETVKARFDSEITSPWRVILLADNPGKFLETELIRTLNPPCAIEDPSWIRPGLSAWDHWWSGEVKMEMPVIKEYIDLAAAEGWPYMLVDWQWYGAYNTPEADITKAAPQLDMPELLRYAKEKGVRLWLWLYCSDVNRNEAYKEAFRLYEEWGIAGVKIDFMDRQDQYMVDWYHRIVEEAARRHLLVDFHGAYKPDGMERTWPNLLTREGVMGNEYNKWGSGLPAGHNVKLAYTRLIAGPMDYTPGGFLNVKPEDHKGQQPALVPNTRSAELAKFVVYESPFTVVCDHPQNILGQDGAGFLQLVPTVWDDTRFLQGTPDTYVAVARRSGNRWLVGVLNNGEARTIQLDTSFLGEGKYLMTFWADGKRPKAVSIKTAKLQAGQVLKVRLEPAGGYVAEIKPL